MEENIVKHNFSVDREKRASLKGHKSFCLWFTGLSGSGKSSIANKVEELLVEKGIHTYILDGDNVRHGLNVDLSFSPEDRKENIRRIGQLANLFVDAGLVTLSTFVSPYQEDREKVRAILGEQFLEVFVDTSLEECIQRDTKGLYAKAKSGEISNLTGYNAPYEAPTKPEIHIKTEGQSIEESALEVIKWIENRLEK